MLQMATLQWLTVYTIGCNATRDYFGGARGLVSQRYGVNVLGASKALWLQWR